MWNASRICVSSLRAHTGGQLFPINGTFGRAHVRDLELWNRARLFFEKLGGHGLKQWEALAKQ